MSKNSKWKVNQQRKQERINYYASSLSENNLYKKDPQIILKYLRSNELKNPIEPWRTIESLIWSRSSNRTYIKDTNIENFYQTLLILAKKKSKMVYELDIVKAIFEVTKFFPQWVRNLEDWNRKSHNAHKQFSEFVRFCLAKYSMPLFLDGVWFNQRMSLNNEKDLYVHLAQGNNIKTFKDFPIDLTKKMRHYFLQAPNHFSVMEAIRYAQVLGLGGDERLVQGILTSNLRTNYFNKEADKFWITVIHFFVNNPMIDLNQIAPLVDYIAYRKNQAENNEQTFSMKGRTVNALLTETAKWHRDLGREKTAKNLVWKGDNISDQKFTIGKDQLQKIFTIKQLLSSNELKAEGREMHHCVASYAHSCNSGAISIWSMTVVDFSGQEQKCVTIELSSFRVINQVRGKYNRGPEPQERRIIEKWAQINSLQFSRWVK